MSDLDSRQNIADIFSMGVAGNASQATILRKEQSRIRTSVITGTLASAALTRVFLVGARKPEMLLYQALVENSAGSADNWVGQAYREANSAADAFHFWWDGPAHATAGIRNSFVFDTVGANLQGKRYRITCMYLEKIMG